MIEILVHRLVKQLYGSTNKCNADWQIAKRYWRHEQAHLAYECKQLREHATQSRTVCQDNQSETTGDSDLRYHISDSKNKPVDILTMIQKNRGDTTYDACFNFFNFLNQALTY